MNIRYAVPSDLPAIEKMYEEFDGTEFDSFGMNYSHEMTRIAVEAMINHGKVIVCEVGDSIVGAIAGIMSPAMTSEDIYFLGALFFVQKTFRTYTSKFLKEAQALIKETKATQFVISVPAFSEYEKSERFYSIAGFRPLETHWIKKL